jgi:hypothetical protein
MTPLTYTFADLKALFRFSTDAAMRRALQRLEAEGFPRRLPCAGARWSQPAVDRWLQTGGTSGTATASQASQPITIAEIEAAYGGT